MADSLITILNPKLDQQQEEELRRENQARYLANQSLGGVAGYMSARGGEMVGRNTAGMLGEMAGVDSRSAGEKQRDAVEQVKAEVSKLGFDPNDPASIDKFYREVIRQLQQRGLVPEAMAVAKEYQAQKAAMTKANASATDAETRRQAAADKRAYYEKKLGTMGPKLMQYLDRLQYVQTKLEAIEEDSPEAERLQFEEKSLLAAIAKESNGQLIVKDAGDRLVVMAPDGDIVREITKGKRPGTVGAGGSKSTQYDRDVAELLRLEKKEDEGTLDATDARKLELLRAKLKGAGPVNSQYDRDVAELLRLEKKEDEGTLDASDERKLELLRAKLKGGKEDEGNKLTAGDVDKVATGLASLRTFVELARTFKPRFSGSTVMKVAAAAGMEDTAVMLKRLFGDDKQAAVWWQRYYDLIATIRNALFGASLTEGETRAFMQIKASPGDEPRVVLQIMRQQADAAQTKAQTKVEGLKAGGFNVKKLPDLVAATAQAVAGMPSTISNAPTTVNKPTAAPAAPAAVPPAVPNSGTTVPNSGTNGATSATPAPAKTSGDGWGIRRL